VKGFSPDRHEPRPRGHAAALRAYTEMRQRILAGEIPKGTVVSEVAMSQAIGVSRTPLREAFRALLNEGLLEGNGPRRQVTVRDMTTDDVEEIVLARRALEQIVARSALNNADEQVTDGLRLIQARMQRAADHGDATAFLEADEEFHVALSEAASVPTVEDFLSRLRALARLAVAGRELGLDRLKELQEVHGRIVDLLADRATGRRRALTQELARCTELSLAMPEN
jgi:GntR family transcriptional regulator, rspAB operon transcriptional repressor